MKESLAAREAALLRQNEELNSKVDAIEQRRQQIPQRTPSFDAFFLKEKEETKGQEEEEDDHEEDEDDIFEEKKKKNKKKNTNEAIKGKKTTSKRSQSPPQQPQEEGDNDQDTTPNEPGIEGLGLEATVRYQRARLRVLQEEVETLSKELKESVSVSIYPYIYADGKIIDSCTYCICISFMSSKF
jgi:hypothetical protein